MRSHILVWNSDNTITAQGVGSYFWWDIFYEYGEWVIASIWGSVYKNCETFQECLNWISEE